MTLIAPLWISKNGFIQFVCIHFTCDRCQSLERIGNWSTPGRRPFKSQCTSFLRFSWVKNWSLSNEKKDGNSDHRMSRSTKLCCLYSLHNSNEHTLNFSESPLRIGITWIRDKLAKLLRVTIGYSESNNVFDFSGSNPTCHDREQKSSRSKRQNEFIWFRFICCQNSRTFGLPCWQRDARHDNSICRLFLLRKSET
jgi:hypothetical protein